MIYSTQKRENGNVVVSETLNTAQSVTLLYHFMGLDPIMTSV